MLAWVMNLGFAASGSNAPAPTPAPSPVTAGGRGKKRKRYYVEIDGQQFLVDSADEAQTLLQRARAIAERQAEEKSARAQKVLRRKRQVPKVAIEPPEIQVSPEIRQEVAPLIEDISRLYAKAAEMAELRLLLAKALADEEEEDLWLLL